MPFCNLNQASGDTPGMEETVQDAFEYHPWNETQKAHGVAVRKALSDAVITIIREVPPSSDRTVAIRKIREARMDCNSAITHGGKF